MTVQATATFGRDTAWNELVEAARVMCGLADAGLCVVEGGETAPEVVVIQELGLLARERGVISAYAGAAAPAGGAGIIQAVVECRERGAAPSTGASRTWRAVRWSDTRWLVIDVSGRGGEVYQWALSEASKLRDLERYEVALDAIGEGILVVDERGRISHCTPCAAALLDGSTPPEAFESRSASTLLALPALTLEPGATIRGSIGTERAVSFLAHQPSPASDGGGPRPGFVVHLRSTTRFAEARKGQLQLLSALRHDVRSPLTALRGLVGVLLEEPDMPAVERQTLLELLQQEAERTVTWVEDYLIILRLRFEPRPSNPVPIPIDEQMKALERTFAKHAHERGVKLTMKQDWRHSAARRTVTGEPALVQAFCNNLIGHFLRLADKGASLAVSVKHDGTLTVDGRGPGLFAKHPPHPFTSIARSTAAGKRTPGVGLGLYLVKRVADVHGWPISIAADDGVVRATVEWAD